MKILFLTHVAGRLANRLMTLRDVQALAHSYGYATIPCVFGSETEFVGTRKHLISRYFLLHSVVPLISREIVISTQMPPDEAAALVLQSLQSGQSFRLSLHGWLPDPLRGFPLPRSLIHRYFHPTPKPWSAGKQAVNRARQGATPVVGVHIRHGDFVTESGGQWFVSLETVVANMRHTQQMMGDCSFVVCSDATFHPDDFPGLSVVLGPGTSVGDLSALMQCDFILKPAFSTFALWAAWWANKPLAEFQTEGVPGFGREDFEVPSLESHFA